MTTVKPATLTSSDMSWPRRLTERLGASAPPTLRSIGPVALLAARKTAIFCSARAPGNAILGAYDAARELRDQGTTAISGFHSPVENECLRILLRGAQPIIWCPARAIENLRIPKDLRPALEAKRLLILSPFTDSPRRTSRASAARRNEIVAALADEAVIAHITPGGQTDALAKRMKQWRIPIRMTA